MSRKIEKVNSLIAEESGRIISLRLKNQCSGLITVTGAECADDLKSAKIWVSFMGAEPEDGMKLLNKNIYDIQKELNRRIEMKFVPRIRFVLDKSGENVAKIDKLLKKEKKDMGRS